MSTPTSKFRISIDDGFCTWTYDFDLPGELCINDIVTTISKAHGAEPVKRELTRGWDGTLGVLNPGSN